jgi:hypothetical protein
MDRERRSVLDHRDRTAASRRTASEKIHEDEKRDPLTRSRFAPTFAWEGRRYLLDAGAADVAGSTEVALSGELGGGELLPPHATRTPAAVMTARSATITMFFMMVSP